MNLTIKPIINELFHATVTHERFTSTAIGRTQNEAAKRAIGQLRKDMEQNSTISNIDFEQIADALDLDEQALHVSDLSSKGLWQSLAPETHHFGMNVSQTVLKISAGTALSLSTPIINAAATAIGIAKTGTAIGTLHGAAHASATAAWIGFGSMKLGMFIMGALPVVGAVMLLDSICGKEYGVPLADWYEEFWKRYEVQCELDELKKTVTVDAEHQVRVKTQAASLTQLGNQFHAVEVEHDLYLLKKQMGLL